MQKNAKFSSAGGSAPSPPCLRRLGALPPNPQPPAAGGFAPRPPLAAGGWGLRPQTPKTAPPHCEFLATRLPTALFFNLRAIGAFCVRLQSYSGNCKVGQKCLDHWRSGARWRASTKFAVFGENTLFFVEIT